MRETWVRALGRKDPLEKKMTTHSSTLAWTIPWTEEPCRLQSMGSQRVGHNWAASLLHFCLQGNFTNAFISPCSYSGPSFKPFSAFTTVRVCFSFLCIYLESSHFTISDLPLHTLVYTSLSYLVLQHWNAVFHPGRLWHSLWEWRKRETNAYTELHFTTVIINDSYSIKHPSLGATTEEYWNFATWSFAQLNLD